MDLLEKIFFVILGAVIAQSITFLINLYDKRRVIEWLKANSADINGKRFRSTRAISNSVNLTPRRVIEACYSAKEIRRNNLEKESWTIYKNTQEDETSYISEIW